MTYYNLLINDDQRILSAVAEDRTEALTIFERELNLVGRKLTSEGEPPAPYMLGETDENPHWVRTDIPIFQIVA